MEYREQVLEYFAEEPADAAKAVRVIEEALGLPGKTLWPVLDAMDKDPTCPLYRAPALYRVVAATPAVRHTPPGVPRPRLQGLVLETSSHRARA